MKHTSLLCPTETDTLHTPTQKNRTQTRHHAADSYLPIILFPALPMPQMKASVIIPAKNESGHIVKTLDALRNQRDEQGNAFPFLLYEILLLANNCTDDTYTIASAYQQQYPDFQLHIAEIELEKKIAHIGTARRLLMDEAFRRHGLNWHDGVILSTDGDTEVDAHWIANTMREMNSGCDAVGGRILTREVNEDSRLYYLQDITYRCLSARLEALIDPAENDGASCHFQCYGASLAVRCSAYQKAGRLPAIPFLEDEAFSRALYRVDARVKKSAIVKVYTSSRLTGRVKAGLSVHLAHLGNMKKENVAMYVESVPTLVEKYKIKKRLRECWHLRKRNLTCTESIDTQAALLHVSPAWLFREMDASVYFGECWEQVEQCMYAGEWKQQQRAVLIEEAIRKLRLYLHE